jgi:hypothetical protein
MKAMLFTIIAALSTPVLASPTPNLQWSTNGTCKEFTPSGVFIENVHKNICRHYLGTRINWTKTGKCYEFSQQGVSVERLQEQVCRGLKGYRINWTESGNCAEFTPTGFFIRRLKIDACRAGETGTLIFTQDQAFPFFNQDDPPR